jgi:hypothetical protein
MKRLFPVLPVLAALSLLALPVSAQAHPPRPPVATVSAVVAPHGPGPKGEEWPTWGNVAAFGAPESSAISDCTFAASADWEMLMGYKAPSEASLIREFHEAGGKDNEGLGENWERWWLHHGINGVHVKLIERPNSWLKALLQIHGSILAATGDHVLIVAGFNATGVEVITYGETREETWKEWNERNNELYVPVIVHQKKKA